MSQIDGLLPSAFHPPSTCAHKPGMANWLWMLRWLMHVLAALPRCSCSTDKRTQQQVSGSMSSMATVSCCTCNSSTSSHTLAPARGLCHTARSSQYLERCCGNAPVHRPTYIRCACCWCWEQIARLCTLQAQASDTVGQATAFSELGPSE